MHFTTLLSVAMVAITISAFQIPTGQPNGVYSVFTDSEGKEIHTLLNTTTTKRDFAIRGASRSHEKRQERVSSSITCRTFEGFLNTVDNGNAATELANQCGNGVVVGPRINYYSIVGCSVAYFCNFKYVPQVCTSKNAWDSFNDINARCGYDWPGFETYSDTNGQDQYGYENNCNFFGEHFCT